MDLSHLDRLKVLQRVERYVNGSRSKEPASKIENQTYHPYLPGESYATASPRNENVKRCRLGLPVPPPELWRGYLPDCPGYLLPHDYKTLMRLTRESGFDLTAGQRVLDFGCATGRITRNFLPYTEVGCEVWGTDIFAPSIQWCQRHLSPPFHFATTTTQPQLPFEDRYFSLIYAISVFTHIDDLAQAWLLELRRVLVPGGRLYVTLHDEATVHLLNGALKDCDFSRWLQSQELYRELSPDWETLVLGRGMQSQVLHHSRWFKKVVSPFFNVRSVTPQAYGYQTAFVLERR